VIIRTNDPSILTLIELDVNGGKGGVAGVVGSEGLGGDGGNPGDGGQGAQMQDPTNPGLVKHLRPGRTGKKGKNGKKGKRKQGKKLNAGNDGKNGKVSFCFYDTNGFKESGGAPFRVMIHKKDIPNLTPVPLNFGALSKDRITDPFLYGQQLQLGPILPVNIGSMYSPHVQFLGRLILQYHMKLVNKIGMLKFPQIPGEQKTRYGELDKNMAQMMKLNLPSLKEIGIIFDTEAWPWKVDWEKVPRIHAIFTFIFSLDGILQKSSTVDKDHICRQDYNLNVELPLEVIGYQYLMNNKYQEIYNQYLTNRQQTTESPRVTTGKKHLAPLEIDNVLTNGDAISGPRSVLLKDFMECTISCVVYNKLQNQDFNKTNFARLVVSVAGKEFYVTMKNVTPKLPNSSDIFSELPYDEKKTNGYQKSSLITTIPMIEKGKIQEFKFQLSFAMVQKKPSAGSDSARKAEHIIMPGADLFIRNELIYDETMAQLTAPHKIRIAPSWPPEYHLNKLPATDKSPRGVHPHKAEASTPAPDLLLFCDSTYGVTDFQVITKLVNLLGLSIIYFDYEHFFTPNNNITYNLHAARNELNALYGKIDVKLWESYLGKLTVLWFPGSPEFANMANPNDFLKHIQQNGSFVNGGKCINTNPINITKETNNFMNAPFRNVVKLTETFNIHALKEFKQNETVLSNEKIIGNQSTLHFILSIFVSMKFEKKLAYLFEKQSSNILNIQLSNSVAITDYHAEPDTSCCAAMFSSKKSKIFPSNKSYVTIRDVLLVAIKVELMFDLGAFVSFNNPQYCHAINITTKFLERVLPTVRANRNKQTAMFCRDIVSAVLASNILEKNKFTNSASNKVFLLVQNQMRAVLSSFQTTAEEFQLDYEGFAERVGDLDILNGFSSKKRGINSDHDAINVGQGISLHLNSRFN
jgi:hypothetical protein